MSLFLRIFISFWVAAILLAASFFILGRYSGGEAIESAEVALEAQAEVVAALWLKGGQGATMHWLFQQASRERPVLVNQQGISPFPQHRMVKEIWQQSPVSAGVHRLEFGRIAVIVQLPEVKPPLYLVKQIGPGHMQQASILARLLLAIVIIGLVSFVLATVLTRPIRRLRNAVQVISAGDLSARVSITGRDEVSALAADFNLMAERVSEMLASQRRLVSDVSHELRSPLARLRIALELAERAKDPASAFTRIEKEADELEQLVTDLLSLARIESGQSSLEKQKVLLGQLIRKIVADANFEGEAHRRQVVLEHCDDASVNGDPVLLNAAIENVVRNGLRFTREGSSVMVRLEQLGSSVVITIDDEGEGVPESALSLLFEPFARVEEARDRHTGGFGLGLAITGRTLLAHGGEARAENRPDGGLRVILTLPTFVGKLDEQE